MDGSKRSSGLGAIAHQLKSSLPYLGNLRTLHRDLFYGRAQFYEIRELWRPVAGAVVSNFRGDDGQDGGQLFTGFRLLKLRNDTAEPPISGPFFNSLQIPPVSMKGNGKPGRPGSKRH